MCSGNPQTRGFRIAVASFILGTQTMGSGGERPLSRSLRLNGRAPSARLFPNAIRVRAVMTNLVDFKYRAFLSYSHADTPWAKWLHGRLERFPLRMLAGRLTPMGPVPQTLRPVFRDREDFSAGHTLTEQTQEALDASSALVVLCSPAAAKSAFVNEEVRLFKERHPDRLIVPVILSGKPYGEAQECFPPALKFTLGEDGKVTDKAAEITIGADVRDREGDGRELALSKVVAALIGVPSDQVHRRAERERQRQERVRRVTIGAIVVLLGAGTYLGIQWRREASDLAAISALVAQYSPIGTAEAAQPSTKEALRAAFEAIVKGTATDPRYAQALALLKQGKVQEAEPILQQLAEEEEAAGRDKLKQAAAKYRNLAAIAGTADPKSAREYYAKAAQLDPENLTGLYWHGETEAEAGDLNEAERAYNAILKAGVKGKDDEVIYWAGLGLGDIKVARGNLQDGMKAYRDALQSARDFAKANPMSDVWQHNLSVALEKVGDGLAAQGDLVHALEAQSESLAIADRLAKAAPNDMERQRNLLVSHNKVGDVQLAKGDAALAVASFRESLAIAQAIAKANPKDLRLQRDLSIANDKIANALVVQGDRAQALMLYKDALAIRTGISAADPNNLPFQRDVEISDNKIGNVLLDQGDSAQALDYYNKGLEIAERLAQAEPNVAQWQRDLSVSYNSIGTVHVSRGELQDALGFHQKALAIAERLAALDPGNTAYLADLAATCGKLGVVYVALGQKDEARRIFQRGRDLLAPFAQKSGNQLWIRYIQGFDAQLASLGKGAWQPVSPQ